MPLLSFIIRLMFAEAAVIIKQTENLTWTWVSPLKWAKDWISYIRLLAVVFKCAQVWVLFLWDINKTKVRLFKVLLMWKTDLQLTAAEKYW